MPSLARYLALIIFFTTPVALAGEVVYRTEKVSLRVAAPGYGARMLDATLRIPDRGAIARTKPDAWPALMVFGGFENAAQVLDLLHPSVPVVLASFDYPYSPPRKFHFPGSLAHAAEVKRFIHETIAGIQQLAAVLRKRPDVDPAKLSIIGASFGAPFALAGASRDSALKGIILVHPFGKVPQTVVHQLMRGWGPRYGEASRPLAWLLAQIGWAYLGLSTPERCAQSLSSEQRLLMISAERDSFIPKEASESLWQSIGASPVGRLAELQIMQGDHVLPGADQQIAEILARVTRWMEKSFLL